jgi:hypothetical protein
LFLLVYPFDSKLLSPLVVLAALPYFLAMASDLHRCGYKRTDVLRIYGFNLILLPVNLAGVAKSLQQAVTGKKIPFARTPKVKDRTATPLLFAVSPFLIIAFSIWTFARDYADQDWGNAAFAAVNTLAASYSVMAFMGIRHTVVDICLGIVERLYAKDGTRPVQIVRGRVSTAPHHQAGWSEVLYRGAAATESGVHFEGEDSFKILAIPPAAPPQHNRRATDRPEFADRRDRRASDRRAAPRADEESVAS